MNVVIIGAGAAGFFAAISCKQHDANAHVTILERSSKLLAKVKVSGGGRCNVTHDCKEVSELIKNYPRGSKELRGPFSVFNTLHTIKWFKDRDVELKIESDGRMFPTSDRSETIVDCFLLEAERFGIEIKTNVLIQSISKAGDQFELIDSYQNKILADKVIVASGGSPRIEGFKWLADLGHRIVEPVPSLFTFNIPNHPIRELMGVSVENASVRIAETKFMQRGPVLITHWGMSGPAVLKLSSFAARDLFERDYHFTAILNWCGIASEEEVFQELLKEQNSNPKRKFINSKFYALPNRLWIYLVQKTGMNDSLNWADLSKEKLRKLAKILSSDEYEVKGKTTFKEEFVTCGGVDLRDIDFRNMQSKVCAGMYFAGEVMDVDAITGGFNFQAAWTSGFIAGKLEERQAKQ